MNAGTEAQYLAEVAAWRWPVLLIIFAFDILVWCVARECIGGFLAEWHAALLLCWRRSH